MKRQLQPVGALTTLVFLLLFSGPPKFRFREPDASLYSELDWSTMVTIGVWVVAGLWLLLQVRRHFTGLHPPLQIASTHAWASVFIICLSISISVSYAPALSAFKIYQVGVMFFLGIIFVQRHGARATFDHLLYGNLILIGLVAVLYFWDPDLVLQTTETGVPRLLGRAVTELGNVTTFGLILLFSTRRRPFTPSRLFTGAIVSLLLVLSFTRSAYLTALLFLLLLFWQRRAGQRMLVPGLALILVAIGVLISGVPLDLAPYRTTETALTLSGRLGLWAHFIEGTMEESPWLGLGFVSGTRYLGMQVAPLLGTGHNIFFESFVGGGLIALSAFLILFALMVRNAVSLIGRRDPLSFAGLATFLGLFVIGCVNGQLDTGETGFTFWMMVSLLPYLRKRVLVEKALQPAIRQLQNRPAELSA